MDQTGRIGNYVIIQRLASGGMAEVYLARKTGAGGFTKPVAIKVILPQYAENRDFIRLFLNEARLASALEHSHICQILDLGEADGRFFIAMEFAHGKDLQQISRMAQKNGRLIPLPYAAKIVSQIAEGLYYAHTKTDELGRPLNVIHRDISPNNIILTYDGISKLIDFGIAKATMTCAPDDNLLKGKFPYMSPEQIRGNPLDARSDIFSLGIVLWELCTGAGLFREPSELLTMEAILRKPILQPRVLRGDIPPDLEAIIMRALAKQPQDRFNSALEMHEAIEAYLNGLGWTIASTHLAEFMRKLFPEDDRNIRELLERERQQVEAEQVQAELAETASSEPFVAWEPYTHDLEPQPTPSQPTPSQPAPRRLIWPFAIALSILAVLVALFALQRSAADPAPAQGHLRLESEPPGAEVSANGEHWGRTPVEQTGLPLDQELTLQFELQGYEVYVQRVRLSERERSASVRVELRRLAP